MLRVAICDDNRVFVNNMSQAVKSEFKRQNNEDIELSVMIMTIMIRKNKFSKEIKEKKTY